MEQQLTPKKPAIAVEPVTAPLAEPSADAGPSPAKAAPTKAQKRDRRKERALAIRSATWPAVGPDKLWILDGKRGGFAQVPRTLSLLMNIIGHAVKKKTGKTSSASNTYLVLWLHSQGEGIARIESEEEVAFEAGYGGERSKSTFRAHMKVLEDLGFIAHSGGARGPFEWVLLYNPYQVLQQLKSQRLVEDRHYTAMVQLLEGIGASKELAEVGDE